MKAWDAPTPYTRQPIDVHTSALNTEREAVNRDRAATLEAGSVVRCHLEAGEVDWEIAPGRKVRGYGFNGQVPGPVLEAKQAWTLVCKPFRLCSVRPSRRAAAS